jgi:hypothetical protein
MRRLATALVFALPALLAGCDMLGMESASAVAARREAEGKAIGAGCRHAARSVEQCYDMNKRADKAAVFGGWKEMNDYMRENKIESAPPSPESAPAEVVEPEPKPGTKPEARPEGKPAPKAGAKTAAKADTAKH